MARKTKDELEKIKKKYNVDRIWSFSRMNAFLNCSYSYYLKYIKFEKEKEDSIYSILGSAFHDILEKFYNNELQREDLITEAENAILNVELSDMKFNKNDDEQNDGIKNKYFECIKHFFNNHIKVDFNVNTERYILIKVGKHLFNGYIDSIHKENDLYIITDYKSSSIYTGKKIPKEGKQLMLYALGVNQGGIPIDKIRCRWNFLKYNSVTFTQKNCKDKTFNCERHAWVGKLKSQLRSNLKDLCYEESDIENLLDQCMLVNSIDILPDEIKNKYTITDCYVEVPIDKEIIENLEKELIETIREIYTKESEYDKTKDSTIWERKTDDSDFYWCSNICGYTPNQCTCYKEFLDNKDLFKTDSGSNEDDNSSWMEELGLI